MPAISIVVPVFNVEKQLESCLNSILSQTFQDFELILVDDGSTDQSGKICDRYGESCNNIHVIHQTNKGVSAARNKGLAIACGEYLMFADSDDTIYPEMFSTMISTAKAGGYDLVVCGMEHYDEQGHLLYQKLTDELELNQDGMMNSLFEMPDPLGGSVCNKLFLHRKIEKVRFNEAASMAEDRMFLFDAYLCLDSCKKIPNVFYKVLERKSSSTNVGTSLRIYEFFKSNYYVLQRTKAYSPQLETKAIDKYLDDCLRYIPIIQGEIKTGDRFGKQALRNSKRLMFKVLFDAAIKKKISARKIYAYTKMFLKF